MKNNKQNNKQISRPKAGSIQLESYLEVWRKGTSKLYDLCRKEFGDRVEKGMDNLSAAEKKGIRSLKKRVAS